ncbi:hypothetical protein F2Q70_00037623 [Brassica cretica]|uniref:DOMON domain-containing protein n=1 Tax=Brassica cretica TaxID=69181 RepID=A0A8S9JXJ7_BRACR|nr:hypothetical protein F2Q70_00037623 [Brassica cretica]
MKMSLDSSVSFIFFTLIVLQFLPLTIQQATESCSSTLPLNDLTFNSSLLQCVEAWTAQNYILRLEIVLWVNHRNTKGQQDLYKAKERQLMLQSKNVKMTYWCCCWDDIEVLHLSTIVNGQQAMDSGNSTLPLEDLALDSSLFQCVEVWSDQNYILRCAKTVENTWSFILSTPDSNAYIAIGFSTNGRMVGSSAIVG